MASRKLLYALPLLLFSQKSATAQTRPVAQPPRLMVGIVVDQMRYDYLLKYYDKFGNGGFRWLLDNGMNCENTHYDYAPTYTGPGHASVWAGAPPSVHGIIGNDWYSREEGRPVYCASDSLAKNVGGTEATGRMSPRRLLSPNLSDELRFFSNKKSKVVGVAIKDRGAILPAGHCPDAAYWFDLKTAGWMTCDWYMPELPAWVADFNKKERPAALIAEGWAPLPETLRPGRSLPDNNQYEQAYTGEGAPTFPHDLPKIAEKDGLGLTVVSSPFGNDLTAEFAMAAIENEGLGADDWPDILALSFSSPDIVGHDFGPTALEIEDLYLRLDRTLAGFFEFLDKKVGEGKWTIFLTADHAAAYNPFYLKDNGLTAVGNWSRQRLADSLNAHLDRLFLEKGLVLAALNGQVVFDKKKAAERGLDLEKIEAAAVEFLWKTEGVHDVLTARQLMENEYTRPPRSLVQRGFRPGESGDLVAVFAPGWVEWGRRGTSHGSPWNYDTRVPCLWYGPGIPKGTFSGRVSISDIAPTAAVLLNCPFPGGATGDPIEAVVSKLK